MAISHAVKPGDIRRIVVRRRKGGSEVGQPEVHNTPGRSAVLTTGLGGRHRDIPRIKGLADEGEIAQTFSLGEDLGNGENQRPADTGGK